MFGLNSANFPELSKEILFQICTAHCTKKKNLQAGFGTPRMLRTHSLRHFFLENCRKQDVVGEDTSFIVYHSIIQSFKSSRSSPPCRRRRNHQPYHCNPNYFTHESKSLTQTYSLATKNTNMSEKLCLQ